MTIFLKKSLTNAAKKRISNLNEQHTVDDHESGTMLLKACILEARTDTQCLTKALHDRLRNFATIMQQQGHDIQKANEVVTDAINSIKARGETPSRDLLACLFEGHKTAPDSELLQNHLLNLRRHRLRTPRDPAV